MNLEQVKVERFFDKLLDKSVKKTVSWFLVSMFVFFIILLCMMPAQEIFSAAEDAPTLLPSVLVIFSYMALNFRVSAYKEYTENQKSRFMTEIMQYHPVSKRTLWKAKMSVLLPFLGKVTVTSLVIQIVISFIAYKTISWMNFAYVIVFVFLFPVVAELVFDAIVGMLKKELS